MIKFFRIVFWGSLIFSLGYCSSQYGSSESVVTNFIETIGSWIILGSFIVLIVLGVISTFSSKSSDSSDYSDYDSDYSSYSDYSQYDLDFKPSKTRNPSRSKKVYRNSTFDSLRKKINRENAANRRRSKNPNPSGVSIKRTKVGGVTYTRRNDNGKVTNSISQSNRTSSTYRRSDGKIITRRRRRK